MPELPDVEGFRKYFEEFSLKKKIVNTELSSPKMLKDSNPSELIKVTEGYEFISTRRHGKYFFAGLSSKKFLVLHFGMTGYFIYYKLPEEASSHIRLQFKFQDGSYIAYDNQRKFGLIMLVDDPDELIKKKNLGIDPVNDNITFKEFNRITEKKSGSIKSLLMDQSVFAGIGNLYSDEIAFQAGVLPSVQFSLLRDENKKIVYKKMMSILKTAVKKDGDWEEMPRNYLLHHRKEGDKCPICSGKIIHKTIAGRTSYFCSKHQKKKM